MEPLAIFGNSDVSSNTDYSRSISLSLFDMNEKEISFKTNESIRMLIPRDRNVHIPSMIFQNVTLNNVTFDYHYVNITNTFSNSLHIEIDPLNLSLSYLFIYKFDQFPQLNSSIHSIDGWTIFSPSNFSNDNLYIYFLDNEQTLNHQSFIFGIRELTLEENSTRNILPITDGQSRFTSDYQLRIYSSVCYYLDENNQWKSSGLRVGSKTNVNETECYSSHLTRFAGGFIVLPEPINWNYVFVHADFVRNRTIYLTLICISIIYILLMIYARYKDKKDLEKLGITFLEDNHQSDKYYYQIIVFTGQRFDSGTKSKVYFILSGDSDQTDVRRLADPNRKILQRGGIDVFVMSVPKCLGDLNCVRIWHDNSGEGSSASWFLKYLIVQDLQTMKKYYFIGQRWFAVEKEDGKIEDILRVANEYAKHQFSYVLSKKAYYSLSDGHLWFSIFFRPPSTCFTRIQRCTCCFVLLFLSMLLNIIYYDQSIEAKSSNENQSFSLTIGSFYITPEQVIKD